MPKDLWETLLCTRPTTAAKITDSTGPPFTVTGVDFTGALYVRGKVEEEKYISVYSHVPTLEQSI